MTDNEWLDRLLGRATSPSNKPAPGPHLELTLAELLASESPRTAVESLCHEAMVTEKRRLMVEVREALAYCRKLDRQRAAKRRVVEASKQIKHGRTPARLLIDEPGVSLQEALRRTPGAKSPGMLPGEAVRQRDAQAAGRLKEYLAERKKLVGF